MAANHDFCILTGAAAMREPGNCNCPPCPCEQCTHGGKVRSTVNWARSKARRRGRRTICGQPGGFRIQAPAKRPTNTHCWDAGISPGAPSPSEPIACQPPCHSAHITPSSMQLTARHASWRRQGRGLPVPPRMLGKLARRFRHSIHHSDAIRKHAGPREAHDAGRPAGLRLQL
eukprot:scaffold10253_cov124-Isochrysis_galbana.AAC.5